MNAKLEAIIKNICVHIFEAVDESDRWWRYLNDDEVEFQHECEAWIDGVHFWTGGFAEGKVISSSSDKHIIYWIDLDFLVIRGVKEGILTSEEVEELKHFFNPERESFDLATVIPEMFK